MIRRIWLTLCFSGLFLSLSAQSEFEWGFSVYPNYSHRRLIAAANLSDLQLRAIEDRETARFSYSAGLLAGWRGERAGVRFGLNFMNAGYQTVKEPFPAGEPNPRDATERRIIYRNLNLELPFELHFIHGFAEKSSFSFMMGLSLSYNLQNNQDTILFFGDISEREPGKPEGEDFRSVNYAFQTGLSYDRKLNPDLAFFLQPHFQFWLSGLLQDNTDLNRNLYALGLKAGLRFISRRR